MIFAIYVKLQKFVIAENIIYLKIVSINNFGNNITLSEYPQPGLKVKDLQEDLHEH